MWVEKPLPGTKRISEHHIFGAKVAQTCPNWAEFWTVNTPWGPLWGSKPHKVKPADACAHGSHMWPTGHPFHLTLWNEMGPAHHQEAPVGRTTWRYTEGGTLDHDSSGTFALSPLQGAHIALCASKCAAKIRHLSVVYRP